MDRFRRRASRRTAPSVLWLTTPLIAATTVVVVARRRRARPSVPDGEMMLPEQPAVREPSTGDVAAPAEAGPGGTVVR